MNKPSSLSVWQPLLFSIMIAAGIVIGYKMNERDEVPLVSNAVTSNVGTGRVEQIIRYIEAKYVDSISSDALVDAAITEVVQQLDPHSMYIKAEDLSAMDRQIGGRYAGLGAEVLQVDDTLHVLYTHEASTAREVGLTTHDRIIAIDDVQLAGSDNQASDLSEHLTKHLGQEAQLTIYRPSSDETLTLPFVVKEQKLNTISAATMMDSLCGYIRIDRFSNNTYEDFMTSLEMLVRDHRARHLIIDLRDNPGGLLVEAVDILSQLFVEKGNLLVYTEDKNGRQNKYTSTGKPFFPIDEIAVVVNENSASSSEIIAGAIQDWDRGVVVGRRTFGKGLIQDQYRLSNESAIRLTTARYYTPSGRSIQRKYEENRTEYEDDWYSRYKGGELFFRDSMQTDTEGRYESKRYRRSLYGGGGITPDIFIGLDTIDVSMTKSSVNAAVTEVAYNYLSKTTADLPATPDEYVQDWTVPRTLTRSLVTTIQDQEGNDIADYITDSTLKSWANHLKIEIGTIHYGPQQVDYLYTQDSEIVKAQDFLLSDLELNDL